MDHPLCVLLYSLLRHRTLGRPTRIHRLIPTDSHPGWHKRCDRRNVSFEIRKVLWWFLATSRCGYVRPLIASSGYHWRVVSRWGERKNSCLPSYLGSSYDLTTRGETCGGYYRQRSNHLDFLVKSDVPALSRAGSQVNIPDYILHHWPVRFPVRYGFLHRKRKVIDKQW